MNLTDMDPNQTNNPEEKEPRILIVTHNDMIGCQIQGMTPIHAARTMLKAADILLDGIESDKIKDVEPGEIPELSDEMRQIEMLMNAENGRRGQ